MQSPAVGLDGPPQVLDGQVGQHVFHQRLLDQLREARAVEPGVEPLLRARMGGAARERALAAYPTGKVVDRYEALFREVLQ